MLYSKPEPVGEVIVICPVFTVQFGCWVAVAVGADGGTGGALTVTLVADETQPVALLRTVTL